LPRSRGFTLYEMLIVLVIVSGLTVLVTFQGQRHQRLLAERAFWPSWQRMWTAGRQTAIHRQEVVGIRVNTAQHLITLSTVKGHQVLGRLRIPPTLQLCDPDTAWTIRPSGASTALRMEWYSTASHNWIYQTFQLGGAIFYVETTATRRSPRVGPA